MTITKIIRLCSTLALALSATATQAASYAGNTFEIEMIVFERPQGMAQTSETWPAEPKLVYPSRWVDFDTPKHPKQTQPEQNDEPISFEPEGLNIRARKEAPSTGLRLSPAATKLDNKAAALTREGDRILFHKAWRQVLVQKHRAPAVLIDGGEAFAGHRQLEGSVTLSVSRYLHLSTNLWLNDFSAPPSGKGLQLPPRPGTTATSHADLTPRDQPSSQGNYEPIILGEPPQAAEQPTFVKRAAHLEHERRMRSGQLHYIDHPAFGVLIEIRTVANPETETETETETAENLRSDTP
ncbi:CsiV family protein [Microbulbifer echini]|uniref:CsiV family protein n=1 Tax=Microbulbifer echini TaxID=1529067 RepID=A0ABV4NTA7_9GAMM